VYNDLIEFGILMKLVGWQKIFWM